MKPITGYKAAQAAVSKSPAAAAGLANRKMAGKILGKSPDGQQRNILRKKRGK